MIIGGVILALLAFKRPSNTNPLNIRYNAANNWNGQVSPVNGFARFESQIYGLRAALKLLLNYKKMGYDNIQEIIYRWAPPSENDTENYIDFVVNKTGIHRAQTLYGNDLYKLVAPMAKMETGANITASQISAASRLL